MSAIPALDTLEPLVDAVREGIEPSGWVLSGLQKTTSYEFGGRWEGESTRSAYLFFHRPEEDKGGAPGADAPAGNGGESVGSPHPALEDAAIEAFLDETSRGLGGNLSLVVDGSLLGSFPPLPEGLEELRDLAAGSLPTGLRRPLSVRVYLGNSEMPAEQASTELRLKVLLPRGTVAEGREAVIDFVRVACTAFGTVLNDPRLRRFLP